MPFTASHAAAVLPFARKPLVTSALVIGSMVPDVPLFGWTIVDYHSTHSLVGAASVDAALGLAVFVTWHVLFAPALVDALPRTVARKVQAAAPVGLRPRLTAWNRWLAIYVSLVVGATTHIAWDAFTHEGRWGVRHVRWLADAHGPLHGSEYAQHASTLLGALLIAWWLRRWCASNGLSLYDLRPTRGAVLACLAVVLAGAANAWLTLVPLLVSGEVTGIETSAFVVATRGIAGAAACAVLLAVLWHGRRMQRSTT